LDNALNVLVIGAGMYVSGRGTDGYGTVLPALCEWKRRGRPMGAVYLACTRPDSIKIAHDKLNQLNRLMDINLFVRFYPEDGEADSSVYKRAIQAIPRPACAIIVVPDHLHSKVAGDCIKAGLHTLVVKPLSPTVKEAKELILLQKEYGVYGAVEFHKRFDRANLKLKEILSQERLGQPLYFIIEYSQKKSIPYRAFTSWVESTNSFQYLGVHYVDVIYFATGAVPRRVMATGQNGWLREKGVCAFDAVHATVEWNGLNGKSFFSYIFTNWIDPESSSAMSDQKLKVIGTKGRYESDQKRRGITVTTDEAGIEEPNPDFCSSYPTSSGDMTYQGYGIESIHTFLHDVTDLNQKNITIGQLEKIRPSFTEVLPSTAIVEAVNNSLERESVWVKVTY